MLGFCADIAISYSSCPPIRHFGVTRIVKNGALKNKKASAVAGLQVNRVINKFNELRGSVLHAEVHRAQYAPQDSGHD